MIIGNDKGREVCACLGNMERNTRLINDLLNMVGWRAVGEERADIADGAAAHNRVAAKLGVIGDQIGFARILENCRSGADFLFIEIKKAAVRINSANAKDTVIHLVAVKERLDLGAKNIAVTVTQTPANQGDFKAVIGGRDIGDIEATLATLRLVALARTRRRGLFSTKKPTKSTHTC